METHKLQLITQISNLKIQQTNLERENQGLREKLRRSELDMALNRSKVSWINNSIQIFVYSLFEIKPAKT